MQVQRKNVPPAFVPVVITLESPDELDIIRRALADMAMNGQGSTSKSLKASLFLDFLPKE